VECEVPLADTVVIVAATTSTNEVLAALNSQMLRLRHDFQSLTGSTPRTALQRRTFCQRFTRRTPSLRPSAITVVAWMRWCSR
jgi:hypothetical protein